LVFLKVANNRMPEGAVAATEPAANGSVGHAVSPTVYEGLNVGVLQDCAGIYVAGYDSDSLVI
jgi:hypothetical protein